MLDFLLIETVQLHSYILPLMQGFCQVGRFGIPETGGTDSEDVSVHYTLISRRSRNRPGLRYQRRGIDEEAHVANFVETEAIMHVEVRVLQAKRGLSLILYSEKASR